MNELAQPTTEWDEQSNYHNDPLYQKVDYIVNRILNEFDTNVSIFAELLQDFLTFKQQEIERIPKTTWLSLLSNELCHSFTDIDAFGNGSIFRVVVGRVSNIQPIDGCPDRRQHLGKAGLANRLGVSIA